MFPALQYYLNLLTSEYRLAANLNAFLAAKLQVYQDIFTVLSGMVSDFDIDQAVGAQIDVIGTLIGVSRTVPFQPSNSVSPVLDDATYKILLKATIAANSWNGTIDGMYLKWKVIFPGGSIVIHDNQNMTATVFVSGSFSSIIQDLINHDMIVPRPEGVLYTYSFAALPVFGFDENDSFIAGFDTGMWS